MPRRRISETNVERFIPNRTAAPFRPPTTPFVSRRIPSICWRSTSRKFVFLAFWGLVEETGVTGGETDQVFCNSAIGTFRTRPRVNITARSIKFSSSRTFPRQGICLNKHIASDGIDSISRFIRPAYFLVKSFTKSGISSMRSRKRGQNNRKNIQSIV